MERTDGPRVARVARTFFFAAIIAIIVAVVVACGGQGASDQGGANGAGQNISIMWTQPLRDHPVHRIMQAGFLSKCEELGYQCEIVGNSGSSFDVPATVSLAKGALAGGGYDAAAVYAADPAIYPFIEELGQQQDLPVVSWHIPIERGTVKGLTAITGTKPEEYAKNAAVAMGEEIGGKGTVAITQGSFNPVENPVAETFTDTMRDRFPDVEVLEPQEEGFEPSAAQAKAVNIIQANPDLVGAFSTTGGGPQTWDGAADQTGKNITIISMDYTRQNLDLVKKGEVYAIVAQPLFEEGAKTAELLGKLAQGEKVPYYNWLPAPIVTKGETGHYYKLLDKVKQ